MAMNSTSWRPHCTGRSLRRPDGFRCTPRKRGNFRANERYEPVIREGAWCRAGKGRIQIRGPRAPLLCTLHFPCTPDFRRPAKKAELFDNAPCHKLRGHEASKSSLSSRLFDDKTASQVSSAQGFQDMVPRGLKLKVDADKGPLRTVRVRRDRSKQHTRHVEQARRYANIQANRSWL